MRPRNKWQFSPWSLSVSSESVAHSVKTIEIKVCKLEQLLENQGNISKNDSLPFELTSTSSGKQRLAQGPNLYRDRDPSARPHSAHRQPAARLSQARPDLVLISGAPFAVVLLPSAGKESRPSNLR
jgi:hypothetical protein